MAWLISNSSLLPWHIYPINILFILVKRINYKTLQCFTILLILILLFLCIYSMQLFEDLIAPYNIDEQSGNELEFPPWSISEKDLLKHTAKVNIMFYLPSRHITHLCVSVLL